MDAHIKNSSLDNPPQSCVIHVMYDYDWTKLNLFNYCQHHRHIHVKEK